MGEARGFLLVAGALAGVAVGVVASDSLPEAPVLGTARSFWTRWVRALAVQSGGC